MALYDLMSEQDLLAELHDDEEEDLVGADWHQDAIRVANEGLLLAGPDRGLPWHVDNQLTVLMGEINGKPWRPCPDLSIHPTLGPTPLLSLDTRLHGVPTVIVEVASEGTYRYDLGAKRRAYAQVGVQEYLLFDPTQDWLRTAVRAWHATTEGFMPWEVGQDGRWRSRVLDVSFEPQGVLLRVFDQDGELMPHIIEVARQIAEQQRRMAELEVWERECEAEIQQLRIAELEAENRQLRGK
jgi:Uma2 family endonuclease